MTRQDASHSTLSRAAQRGSPRAVKAAGKFALRPRSHLTPEVTPVWYVGIDPGVTTGLAKVRDGALAQVTGVPLHVAMDWVRTWATESFADPRCLLVVYEDARLRTWFGTSGRERLMGAGSVRRDSGIWEEFLTALGCQWQAVSPEGKGAKLTSGQFRARTGWSEPTNQHGRDAGMLVAGWLKRDAVVDYLGPREGQMR